MMAARWYMEIGKCFRCGKQATVILYNHRNASLGPHCKRCAEKLIKADKDK